MLCCFLPFSLKVRDPLLIYVERNQQQSAFGAGLLRRDPKNPNPEKANPWDTGEHSGASIWKEGIRKLSPGVVLHFASDLRVGTVFANQLKPSPQFSKSAVAPWDTRNTRKTAAQGTNKN